MRYLHHLRLTLDLALVLHFLGRYALPTLANTEIVNFAAGNPVVVEAFPTEDWCVTRRDATTRLSPPSSFCVDVCPCGCSVFFFFC